MIKKIIKYFIRIISDLFGVSFFVKKKTKNNNYDLIDKNIWIPFFYPDKYFSLYKEGLKKSNQEKSDNFSKNLRHYSLLQSVRHVLSKKNLENYNFVECGCWTGHSSYIISKILKEYNFKNKFYIFDSFEGGLSDLEKEDKSLFASLSEEEIKDQKDYCKSNENDVRNLLKNFEFVEIFKCWIPEKFHNVADKKFQFIHLDVDLYQPTKDSLEFFYPKLAQGGIIVCDDYNFTTFPGAKKAWDDFFKHKKNTYNFFYETPFGGCFLIK
jgi:hypothetical protein|tara:strand:- start:273 stop:1076 length:804 start_codon:yes stop_codon:yes gene_type:complete